MSRWAREARYLITDWGGAMGKWGSNVVSRGRWDPDGFEAQTAAFVTGVNDGFVSFGYRASARPRLPAASPWRTSPGSTRTARRLTEQALHGGLVASGATEEEAARFARALTDRIRQLGDACGSATEEARRTDKGRMSEHRRTMKVRAAIVVLGVVVGIAALGLILHTPFVRARVLRYVLATAQEQYASGSRRCGSITTWRPCASGWRTCASPRWRPRTSRSSRPTTSP